MAIAFQRFGRFKRWIGSCISGFFCGIKNGIMFVLRGGRPRGRPDENGQELIEDKDFQVTVGNSIAQEASQVNSDFLLHRVRTAT